MKNGYFVVEFKNGKKVLISALNKQDAEILASAMMIKNGLSREIEKTYEINNLSDILISNLDYDFSSEVDVIDEYFNQLKRVYEYFEFKEDYVIYPLENYRDYYWKIDDNSSVIFGEKEDVVSENGKHYVYSIYTQRFYDKWIYRGDKYTMIFVNTHTDGNIFFGIYDNSKEII